MFLLEQNLRLKQGLAPVANAFAAGSSLIIDIRDCEHVLFVALMGVAGGADRITFTVDACSNAAAALTAQCKIMYRLGQVGGDNGEIMDDVVFQVTPATGSTQIAAADCATTIHLIEVDAAEARRAGQAAATAFDPQGVRLTWATSAAGGIVGAVLAIKGGLRYGADTLGPGVLV